MSPKALKRAVGTFKMLLVQVPHLRFFFSMAVCGGLVDGCRGMQGSQKRELRNSNLLTAERPEAELLKFPPHLTYPAKGANVGRATVGGHWALFFNFRHKEGAAKVYSALLRSKLKDECVLA